MITCKKYRIRSFSDPTRTYTLRLYRVLGLPIFWTRKRCDA